MNPPDKLEDFVVRTPPEFPFVSTHWPTFVAKSVVAGLALAFVVVALRPDLLGRGAPAPVFVASFADAVEKTAPSVVNIYAASAPQRSFVLRPGLKGQPPPTEQRTATSLGSGVILSADGYVVTNDHVIADAEELFVSLHDGRVARATVVGVDPDTDLALLHIEATGLPAMPLGRSDELRTGDMVIAIGNPFGIGQTVTQGIVSATGRDQLGLNSFENFIQTDAAINPGNSGGALVNIAGAMVGINTAIVSSNGSEGIGFAIPVNLVRGVVEQLIENGRVVRGWLGVNAENLSPGLASLMGIGGSGGILLTGVYPNTPAEQAGLRSGDVIVAVNQRPITKLQDALHQVAQTAPGTTIQLSGLHRNGEPFDIQTKVIERPITRNFPARGS